MCAFILNGFRLLFFIQIDYLKRVQGSRFKVSLFVT